MRAVPDLLKMMDDATLDATIASWASKLYATLLGAAIGSDLPLGAPGGPNTPAPDRHLTHTSPAPFPY